MYVMLPDLPEDSEDRLPWIKRIELGKESCCLHPVPLCRESKDILFDDGISVLLAACIGRNNREEDYQVLEHHGTARMDGGIASPEAEGGVNSLFFQHGLRCNYSRKM